MKKILVLSLLAFLANCSFSQNHVRDFWWRIEEHCFNGTHINKHNGCFMSTVNNKTVGTIFTVHRGATGRLRKPQLYMEYNELRRQFQNYPLPAVPSETQPCAFVLQQKGDDSIRISGKFGIDNAVSADILHILNRSKILKVSIAQWGLDEMATGPIEGFFRTNRQNTLIEPLRDGEKYIVLAGIWVKNVTIDYSLDNNTRAKFQALLEKNDSALKNAGLSFAFDSKDILTTTIAYDNKFYPFLKFARITPEGEVKAIAAQVLEDVDFYEFNTEAED